MSCCGDKRSTFHHNPTTTVPDPRRPVSPAPPQALVVFEYTGATALTVAGAITGRRYRFAESGAAVSVDLRDGPSLAGVPHLRRRR